MRSSYDDLRAPAPDSPSQTRSGAELGSSAREARPSVLLVDDRPANLDALEGLLQPLDLRLVRATSANDALREVLRNDFAVILLDVQMPIMDGPQVARLIKARSRSELVPIIFLTALEHDRRRITAAYECGAVDYVIKPLDSELLRAKVRAFVELHQKREDATWRQRRRFADLAEQARIDAEAAQQASEQRLHLALDAARMVAWEWDPATERIAATGNVREIYGVSEISDSAAGFALVHPDDRQRHSATVHAAAEGGVGYRSEFRIVRPDTEEIIWLEERGAMVRNADGRLAKMVGVVMDVTERKRTETEHDRLLSAEREARAQAEVADRAKSEFLATMSHELRTPLNAIVGYVQLLEMGLAGPLTDQQREYLSRLRASGQHLLGLVNDVLDLAKVDAGQMVVAREHARADAAAEAAVALAQPEAEARGVTILNHCTDDGRVAYVGDEHRVRQILLNLLSNAVKFTDPGGRVEVKCATADDAPTAARLGGGGPWIVVRVCDSGVGIAPEQQHVVFEAFHQVEQGTTRTKGGTGLGLAISRRLARLMGGDLTLESEVGRGSEFSLWLPSVAHGAGAKTEGDETAAARGARAQREVVGYRVHGLDEVGTELRAQLEELIESFTRRLRTDPMLRPAVRGLDHAALEDHYMSFLADLCQSLVVIGQAGVTELPLLRDGSEIQRVVSELHGRQRYRLGWTEGQVAREYEILEDEVLTAVHRRVPETRGDISAAVEVIVRLLSRAADIGARAFRQVSRSALA
jgi:PAS domain S-box-containing protein